MNKVRMLFAVAVLAASSASGAFAAADPAMIQVQGDQLLRCNVPLRLKGANFEGNRNTSNTIWRSYWAWRDITSRSLEQAQAMGLNAVRVIFPDGSIDLDGNGGAQSYELDKLADMLALLDAHGMGAIVTVFNRHDYANADRTRDARKVASFLARFGSDSRVLLWDIVNEPQPMGDPNVRGKVLDWLGAMRTAFDATAHAQPITIGAIGHYDVVITEGRRSIIDLSDVVSVHCYGHSHPTATPAVLDGVNYQQGYCKASMQYIRNRTGKPILLEEFGWPDRESKAWPPAHPWRIFEMPRTPAGQNAMYAEILSAADQIRTAGAIQWALEDTPDDGFGLLDKSGNPKRPGTSGAYDMFRGWGGASAKTISKCAGQPGNVRPDGSAALLFKDTSTVRVSRGDWDFCHGKADCANGEAVVGLSLDLGVRQGRRALCRAQDTRFGGAAASILTLDASADQRRARRVADWDSGYFKLECGANEYVASVAENANSCAGNNGFHALICARASGLSNNGLGSACRTHFLASGDDRAPGLTDDWDPGAYKAECAKDEFVAGVSAHPSSRSPHAILCCKR